MRHLRIGSRRMFADEVGAGMALSSDIGQARTLAAQALGLRWHRELTGGRVSAELISRLCAPARDLNIGCLITDLAGVADELIEGFADFGWSVTVAAPTRSKRRTQWNGAPPVRR